MDTTRISWRWWLVTTMVLIVSVAMLLGDAESVVGSKYIQQAALIATTTAVSLMAMRLGVVVRAAAQAGQREVGRQIRRRRYTAVQLHYRDVMGIDS